MVGVQIMIPYDIVGS